MGNKRNNTIPTVTCGNMHKCYCCGKTFYKKDMVSAWKDGKVVMYFYAHLGYTKEDFEAMERLI